MAEPTAHATTVDEREAQALTVLNNLLADPHNPTHLETLERINASYARMEREVARVHEERES